MPPISRSLTALAAVAGLASPALATWSIVLVDLRTGEVAVGSATCLTNFDLRANTPVLLPGVGGAAAQSAVDSTGQNRVFIRDRLALGTAPADILTQLATFDTQHQSRQYGIVDAQGRAASFSGTGDGAYAGGATGQFSYFYAGQGGTIAYAIQGNVLTGAPVVDRAVQAVITTDGDLAARLMAGMQAAREMGGDGRCSCNPTLPTSCGSPPPSFTKAAHIGYMLVARLGDREGSNGVYRSGSGTVDVALRDLGTDGLPDLLATNQSTNTLAVLANITPPSRPFPMFGPAPTTYAIGGSARGMAVGDVTGDGRIDVLVADATNGAAKLLRGNASGAFDAPVTFGAGLTPRAVAAGDFDGQFGLDYAVACFDGSAVSVRLSDGLGGFGPVSVVPVDAGPIDIVATNLIGGPAVDLAVACRTASRLAILTGDGAGNFTPTLSMQTAGPPVAVAAADLDGDGDTDLVIVSDTGQLVQVFLNQGGGAFTPTTYALGFTGADVAIGDVNGDGSRDLVVSGSSRFATFFGNGAGAFTLNRTYTVAAAVAGVALADMDGDGDLDVALACTGVSSVLTVKNYGPGPMAGVFNDGIGCATGDYFLNFNVAFQTAASPDPVLQLQALYDQWRAALVGHADAVQSSVSISPPYLPSDSASVATMTIRLRDWHGDAATAPVTSLLVTPAPGFPAVCTIGTPASQGGGVYTVPLTAGAAAGLERLRIVLSDGARPVQLTPDASLSEYTGTCYANCDGSINPPLLSMLDFTCFLQRFGAGEPYANCDGSTAAPVLNVADFGCFLRRFAAGCP
jgi:hypothetical protein